MCRKQNQIKFEFEVSEWEWKYKEDSPSNGNLMGFQDSLVSGICSAHEIITFLERNTPLAKAFDFTLHKKSQVLLQIRMGHGEPRLQHPIGLITAGIRFRAAVLHLCERFSEEWPILIRSDASNISSDGDTINRIWVRIPPNILHVVEIDIIYILCPYVSAWWELSFLLDLMMAYIIQKRKLFVRHN